MERLWIEMDFAVKWIIKSKDQAISSFMNKSNWLIIRYFVDMNIEARKYHLIERLMRFDEKDLSKVEMFLESNLELTASLDRALQQVEEGKVTPHAEVRRKYGKWL